VYFSSLKKPFIQDQIHWYQISYQSGDFQGTVTSLVSSVVSDLITEEMAFNTKDEEDEYNMVSNSLVFSVV
jgi:hypothetical protein